jgi:aryl-alcohol dehydrogenase-like predicted oxidoreductase
MKKEVILGTAYLGQKYFSLEFSQMYEVFTEHGFNLVDTAVNYPITGNPKDFSAALNILRDLGLPKKSVYVKVGGCQNKGTPDNLLNESYLRFTCELIHDYFQDSLFGIGIHWDNRKNHQEILNTLQTLESIQNLGLTVGFSGVKQIQNYTALLDSKCRPYIVQHNLRDLTTIQTSNYSLNWVYGLAKFKQKSVFTPDSTLDILMNDDRIGGALIGPTNVGQLKEWLETLNAQR